MAVYCGVCADRIDSARENYGSFKVDATFDNGWDFSEPNGYMGNKVPVVRDTCESCARALKSAVAVAAVKIARENSDRVANHRIEKTRWDDETRRLQRERDEFERDWIAERARRRASGG